jgi:hypothetical protein
MENEENLVEEMGNCQSLDQSTSLSMFCCNKLILSISTISVYIFRSSAYNLILTFGEKMSATSLIYNKNNERPNYAA